MVHVLVWRDDALALLRRARTGFMDGYYSLPGGHLNHGESLAAAAARECREELGVVTEDLSPVCVLPYRSGRHQGFNFVFESHRYRGAPRINEPELFDALVWAAPAELPEPHAPWIGNVLKLRANGRWFEELHWD